MCRVNRPASRGWNVAVYELGVRLVHCHCVDLCRIEMLSVLERHKSRLAGIERIAKDKIRGKVLVLARVYRSQAVPQVRERRKGESVKRMYELDSPLTICVARQRSVPRCQNQRVKTRVDQDFVEKSRTEWAREKRRAEVE
jgi:hypothetical protein